MNINDVTDDILSGAFTPDECVEIIDDIYNEYSSDDGDTPDEDEPDDGGEVNDVPVDDDLDEDTEIDHSDLIYYPSIAYTNNLEELQIDSTCGFREDKEDRHCRYMYLSDEQMLLVESNPKVREFIEKRLKNNYITPQILESLISCK